MLASVSTVDMKGAKVPQRKRKQKIEEDKKEEGMKSDREITFWLGVTAKCFPVGMCEYAAGVIWLCHFQLEWFIGRRFLGWEARRGANPHSGVAGGSAAWCYKWPSCPCRWKQATASRPFIHFDLNKQVRVPYLSECTFTCLVVTALNYLEESRFNTDWWLHLLFFVHISFPCYNSMACYCMS